jgi:hypothetical protein
VLISSMQKVWLIISRFNNYKILIDVNFKSHLK